MVVFNTERPVGRETILKADAEGPAPTGAVCCDQADSGGIVEYRQPIAGDSRTALDIKQRRIPGPTELTSEETDGVGLCRRRDCRIEQAHARILDVSPISLRFQTKHKLIGLPAVANLPTGKASGTITAAARDRPHGSDEIHATAALAPSAVGTDVEAGPIVDWRNHRGRLSVRTSRQIRSARGRRHAE